MLRFLGVGGEHEVIEVADGWDAPDHVAWIDLYNPTHDEDAAVERALGLSVPTRADMDEIEISSRLYRKGDALYLTVLLMKSEGEDLAMNVPLTFIITPKKLVTVRYHQPKAFEIFLAEAMGETPKCAGPRAIFLGLMEAVVDRTADKMEAISAHVENIGSALLRQPKGRAFEPILRRLGRSQTANARARDSLVSLGRLLSYAPLTRLLSDDAEQTGRLATMQRDVAALTDHATYVTDNITFLLDAATGMISTEQNAIMKIFSIMAVVFLPPTLIGSIYGMNFTHMPELGWKFGYPMALILMVLSAVLPIMYFKKKNWL